MERLLLTTQHQVLLMHSLPLKTEKLTKILHTPIGGAEVPVVGSGFVISSGRNSHGRWIKYADGTAITYSNFTSIDCSTVSGAFFVGDVNVERPLQLSNESITIASSSAGYAIFGLVILGSGASAKIKATSYVTGQNVLVSAVIFGNWK